MRTRVACLLASLLVTATASAQPGAPLPPPPDAPPPPVVPAEPAPPPPPAPAPVREADPPELEATFQAGITALGAGRFAEAAALFDDVALQSSDPVRQTTAAEMARQARSRIPPEAPGGAPRRSNDGRYLLVGSASILGLALYGPTLPVLADPNDDKAAVGLYMLGAGGTFFGAWLATRDADVSLASATAWVHGSTRGILHGAALLALIDADSDSGKGIWATLSLASIAEGTAGALWADHVGATTGIVNTMGHLSDVGGLSGMALAYVLTGDSLTPQGVGASALLGTAAGYGAGYLYARSRNPTWGDGEVLRATTVMGAYTALLPLLYAEADNERVYAGAAVAGAAAGVLVGDRLLAGRDFSAGQGIVMELAPQAGGLVGAGLGYLIAPNGDGDTSAKIIATGAVLGSIAAFGAAYVSLDTRRTGGGATTAAPRTTFQLTPDLRPGHKGLALAGSF